MPNTQEVIAAIRKWIDLLESNAELADEFRGYNKTFLITLPDMKLSVQMVFEGTNKAHLVEGTVANPDMSLTVDSKLFLDICSGEVDPMEAFMTGRLKPKGNMADLQKLEVFMDLFED